MTSTGPKSDRIATFGALRHRDFRLFWMGACFSFIGSWVQIVALGLYVYESTGSKSALGLVGLASGLPTTVFLLFGGVVADRVDKRKLLTVTQAIFAAAALIMGFLALTERMAIWHVIVISLVNGLVFALDGPARQAMIYDLVGPDDLATGIALQSAAFNVARVVGPVVASLIYVGVGPAWCFFVNALSFVAIIIAIRCIRTNLSSRTQISTTAWRDLCASLQYLRGSALAIGVVSMTAATSIFAFSNYSTLMPALARDLLGIADGDRRYGLLFSAIGCGSLVGVYLVSRFSAQQRRGLLMVSAAAAFAVVLLALGRTHSIGLAIPLFVLVGMCAVSQLATANTLTQTLAPDGLHGRAVALHMFAMAGLQPFGAFLAGAVAQRWGVSAALTLGPGLLLVYVLFTIVWKPQIAALS